MLTRDEEAQARKRATREELRRMRDNMLCARHVYSTTADGVQQLCNLIVSAGIFDKIDPADEAAQGARNLVIDVLNGLGVLCESTLPSLVKAMLSLPVPFSGAGGAEEE